jgi:alanine-glyoxylate transaminase/serine-glyoxylate transaminase/serine-pyruvate transaminase
VEVDVHLMIPGPVPVAPEVAARCAQAPSHVAPAFVATFQQVLHDQLTVWGADASHHPFVVPGGGTVAMEAAATNLVECGDRVVVVVTGVFGHRMAEMLRRRGADVVCVTAEVGEVPRMDEVREALQPGAVALFATHVDTSTGVRVDPEALAQLAMQHGALSVFDGVCATAAERFHQADWGADVYLTASQKALSVPPGLALWVMSDRALQRRRALTQPPPMSLDALEWLPVMEAYRGGRGAYFSTPATGLVGGLAVSMGSMVSEGMPAVVARQLRCARALRRAWSELGLRLVAAEGHAAHTLSALHYPEGVGDELLGAIAQRGVSVAGGLHPMLKGRSLRVGHMGWVLTQEPVLVDTVRAIGEALVSVGHDCDPDAAVAAYEGDA